MRAKRPRYPKNAMIKTALSPLLKTLPLTLAACWMATSAVAATIPLYTAWVNDYTGEEAHTIGLWKFDNPDPAANSSTNPAYAHPEATFHSTGTQTGVPGKFGEAFLSTSKSTANNSYASFTSTPFNGSAMSVEFWYSPLSTFPGTGSSYSYLFDKMFDDNSGMKLILTNTNKLRLTIGNGTAIKGMNPSEAITLVAGEWYHFAVTYENAGDQIVEGETIKGDGTVKLFLNGNLLAEATYANFGDLNSGTRGWRLANRVGSTYGSLPGYYDNFRISDIAYNYGPAPIPEPGTIASLALMLPLFWGLKRSGFLKVPRKEMDSSTA